MTRLSLFDLGDDEPTGPPLETVSELTGRIKSTLERRFAEVAVRAEVSNVARPRSGHIYLVLKDDGAQVRAVLWKAEAQQLVFDLVDGLAVTVWGKLAVYAPRGEYQVTIRKIEPEGIGALELAFRQTMARLAAEGLFDPERKRPLPRFPRRIVVVTSPSGAAVRDLLQVISRRWRASDILIAPTRVQGVGAAEEVAEAIALANRVAGADLVILARGGGSLEDLWAFNEEIVARAIVGSALPVMTAIGHEVDLTIADLAADRRALTPSEAGELCVPDALEIRRTLSLLAERIASSGRIRLQEARSRVDAATKELDRAVRRDLDGRRHRLGRLATALEALSPLAVLARGYSLTFQADGVRLVRSADDVQVGDLIETRLASGQHLTSRVEGRS
ncbi:exodeoxyribonuclease VII large subunit [Singulisphaera sp. Ch08]|uniref:Exodeoxyribonuclease 7 large subunit n=1 Tax=Singulisphaera sp. Ch08 TaxID=3120278 RepID=A0AAU7CLG0_9BACT